MNPKSCTSLASRSLALGVFVLAGCSTLPTAPELPAAGQEHALTTTPSPDALQYISADGGTSVTVRVNGTVGATLSAGRFTVVIPAGALRGTSIVTLSQPDTTVLQCDLQVSPSVVSFGSNVTVQADCSRLVNRGRMKRSFISFLDRGTSSWKQLDGSKSDLATSRLTASSSVCSSYRVEGGNFIGY